MRGSASCHTPVDGVGELVAARDRFGGCGFGHSQFGHRRHLGEVGVIIVAGIIARRRGADADAVEQFIDIRFREETVDFDGQGDGAARSGRQCAQVPGHNATSFCSTITGADKCDVIGQRICDDDIFSFAIAIVGEIDGVGEGVAGISGVDAIGLGYCQVR